MDKSGRFLLWILSLWCLDLVICCVDSSQVCAMCYAMLSCFSRVRLCATLWTVALQAPLTMGISRFLHWSGFLFPSPRDLPDLRVKPASLKSPALAGGIFTTSASWAECFLSPGSLVNQLFGFLSSQVRGLRDFLPHFMSSEIALWRKVVNCFSRFIWESTLECSCKSMYQLHTCKNTMETAKIPWKHC